MYITYKITNIITGDYYIGSHKTNDINDNYWGSGKLIKDSIAKYGIENHKKEIIEIFNNRDESIELEHKLIKQKKQEKDAHLLNMSVGGTSFDYINDNLTFDRVAFGKMASHKKCREENIEKYNLNPNLCLYCGKSLNYEQRHYKFCSSSCSASYNNSNKPHKIIICKYCGKQIVINDGHYNRQFCNNSCSAKYINQHREKTELQKMLLKDKDKIQLLHTSGVSYREIAKQYNTSGNTIKDLLKGKIK